MGETFGYRGCERLLGTGGVRDPWVQEVGESIKGGRDFWVQEVGETFGYRRCERVL